MDDTISESKMTSGVEMDKGSGITEGFEGPEKLLEIWFLYPKSVNGTHQKDKKNDSKRCGLRSVPEETWKKVLQLVHCSILHSVSNEYFDAYVLSESSLFVWDDKVILKTCGTTVLLPALPVILSMAKECGLTVVGNVFYSRRNFFYQAKQLAPHSSFDDEVRFLDEYLDGSAYVLGKKNGDHWYLYLTDKDQLLDNSSSEIQRLPSIDSEKVERGVSDRDFTLEILMTDLDPDIMRQFYRSAEVTAQSVTKSSGIADLFSEATLDSFLFDPCGYSMNGLLGSGYFTIHITPQPSCSYVSFETNIHCDYASLIKRVLQMFKPKKFTVSLFAGYITKKEFTKMLTHTMKKSLEGFHRRNYARYEFSNNYELAFANYDSSLKGKRKRGCS